jgi:hypothetical protein
MPRFPGLRGDSGRIPSRGESSPFAPAFAQSAKYDASSDARSVFDIDAVKTSPQDEEVLSSGLTQGMLCVASLRREERK